MKKRRSPFVLLELLLGLTLLTLFTPFLVRGPLEEVEKTVAGIEILECNRLFPLTFSEIKELFFLQRIPWDAEGKTYRLPPVSYSRLGGEALLQRSFHIRKVVLREGKTADYQKIEIKITFAGRKERQSRKYFLLRVGKKQDGTSV